MKTLNASSRYQGTLRAALVLLLAPGFCLSASSENCERALQQFLHAPSASSLQALCAVDEGSCWMQLQNSPERLQQLDRLVAQGNGAAAQLMARLLPKLDGGELEDAQRALGQFSTHDMRGFLRLASAGPLTAQDVADALTMLPLNIDEDPAAHLREMHTRRSAVEQVTDADVSEIRKVAIQAIDSFIVEIERAKASMSAQEKQRS